MSKVSSTTTTRTIFKLIGPCEITLTVKNTIYRYLTYWLIFKRCSTSPFEIIWYSIVVFPVAQPVKMVLLRNPFFFPLTWHKPLERKPLWLDHLWHICSWGGSPFPGPWGLGFTCTFLSFLDETNNIIPTFFLFFYTFLWAFFILQVKRRSCSLQV